MSTSQQLPEIGLESSSLSLAATLPELIDVAGRNGFRRVAARPYTFVQALEAGFTEADLRRRLADAGVEVTMMNAITHYLPGITPPDDLDPAFRARMPPDVLYPIDADTCLRAAEVLGAGIANVTAFMGTPQPLERMADAVADLCRRAADHGVRIALESVPDSGMPDLATAQEIVEACGEPNCGLLFDVYHLDRSGGTVEDVRRLPPGAIVGIQLSDRVRPPAGTDSHVPFGGRCMPGEGDLPLRDLITAALENSPDAKIDLEVLYAELQSLPMDEIAARLSNAVRTWAAASGFTMAPDVPR